MDDYRLSAKDLRSLKSALSKAKKQGPEQVIRVCDRALRKFELEGCPDCWQDFQRARDDAEHTLSLTPQ